MPCRRPLECVEHEMDELVGAVRPPERDLVELMQDARALAFPSLTEGFGLPVLEAEVRTTRVVLVEHPTVAMVPAAIQVAHRKSHLS